jgi:hypothetical protein
LKDWQVQWKYAKIPSNYIDNNGAIQTAIVGDRYGKTLVLAGSTGISVLSMNTGIHAGKHNKSYLSCRSGVYYDGIRIQHIHIQDKWKMFRRRDERKVVISSMVLWENYIDNGDDLIIAIASYRGHANCEDSDTYLVAWSSGG